MDEDGLLVDDGTVFKHADDHLWMCTNGNERAEYFADATKGLEVSIDYIAPELPSMQIQGPRSRELMRTHHRRADRRAGATSRSSPTVQVGGVPAWVSRTGFSGELGYEVFLRPEHAEALWEAVESAGATPYGVEIIEPIRVETGMIVTDYDYEEHERSPFDLGLDRMVALDAAGEFMGKDELRDVAADPPNRFKTIRLEGDALPEYGAAVTQGRRGRRGAHQPRAQPEAGAARPRDHPHRRRRSTAPRSTSRCADGSTVGGHDRRARALRPDRRHGLAPERRGPDTERSTTRRTR